MGSFADQVAVLAALLLVAAGLVFLAAQRAIRRLSRARNGDALPPGLDRRRHTRRPVYQVTACLASAAQQDRMPVENISPGGMCVAVGAGAVPAQSVVQATLMAPGLTQPISAEARAVWVEDGRAGLQFTRVDMDLRRWLDSL